jgi:hypothetical protein
MGTAASSNDGMDCWDVSLPPATALNVMGKEDEGDDEKGGGGEGTVTAVLSVVWLDEGEGGAFSSVLPVAGLDRVGSAGKGAAAVGVVCTEVG